MSATVRQKAAASVKKQKKSVIKPVLTSPYEVQWPVLSEAAQQQIESALLAVLQPLYHARINASSLRHDASPSEESEHPVASTSRLQDEGDEATRDHSATRQQTGQDSHTSTTLHTLSKGSVESAEKPSKRAKRRRRALRRIAQHGNHLPADTHELTLRSGKRVNVPDRPISESFVRRIKLDGPSVLQQRPAITEALVLGLNNVSRRIENTIRAWRCQVAGTYLNVAKGKQSSPNSALRNLRLFVPSPTRGTRRDRRALRMRLDPEERKRRNAAIRKRALKLSCTMPEMLTGVPRGEPALIWILEYLHNRVTVGGESSSSTKLEEILQSLLHAIRQPTSVSDRLDESHMDTRDGGPSPPSAENEGTVALETQVVQDLLFNQSALITDDERSILISLLSRHDPRWFVAQHSHLRAITPLQKPAVNSRVQADYARAMPAKQKAPVPEPEQTATPQEPPLRIVFVAKADINPAALVDHLTLSVGAQNGLSIAREKAYDMKDGADPRIHQPLLLVPLGKGAEARLANVLGLRRAAVIGFTNSPGADFQKLVQLVKSHIGEPATPAWLIPPVNTAREPVQGFHALQPTRVKHLATTAAVDPKAARAEKQADKKRKLGADESQQQTSKKAKADKIDDIADHTRDM